MLGLAGCDPDAPDPGGEPAARLFASRLSFDTGSQPIALAVADFNGDGRPDVAVANAEDATVTVLLGTERGGFRRADYPVGEFPAALAAADLNGSGLPDLVVACLEANAINFLHNLGDGAFGPTSTIGLGEGTEPNAIAAADFNGDGVMDLAVTYGAPGADVVAVMLADQGGYLPPMLLPVGSRPRAVLAEDLNGDGAPDLLVTNRDGGGLTLYPGLGDGGFAGAVELPAGGAPRMTRAVDLTGNGLPDLVTTNPGSGTITTLLADGAGGYVEGPATALDRLPSRFAAGDFNGDGRADLAVPLFRADGDNPPLGQVAVLPGLGGGAFGDARVFGAGAGASDVAAGDMDGDGRLDLVSADTGAAQVSVLRGRGNGSFESDERLPGGAGPRVAAAADLDGNGRPDVVVLNQLSSDLSVYMNGPGGLRPRGRVPVSSAPRGMAVGDLNGDGRPDVVVTLLTQSAVAVFLGNGDGTFQAERRFDVRGPGQAGSAVPRSVAIGDLDNDGIPDLVTGNSNLDALGLLRGLGDGRFGEARAAATMPPSNFPLDVQLVDLTRNGILDVVFLSTRDPDTSGDAAPPRVVRMLGRGDGSFDPATSLRVETGPNPRALAAADLDGDGDVDVVTAHASGNNVYLLPGTQAGGFTRGTAVRAGAPANSVALADVTGNGRRDIVTTNDNGLIGVLPNRGGLLFAAPVLHGAGDQPIGAVAVDLDGDGRPDVVFGNRGSGDVSVLYGIR